MEVFFEEIKNKELESPFSFYIYLIEQTDEDNIVDFFQNIDGLRTFKNNSLIYIQNKKRIRVALISHLNIKRWKIY
ncbi:hypothetical protein [Enterococcus durans]|uniref:hypothetical protein n=1 Tax=Enterococcus durans TaxID=53345 RepID=UPI001CF2CFFA|nr:hypothetical protein [Enterococcus durans]